MTRDLLSFVIRYLNKRCQVNTTARRTEERGGSEILAFRHVSQMSTYIGYSASSGRAGSARSERDIYGKKLTVDVDTC